MDSEKENLSLRRKNRRIDISQELFSKWRACETVHAIFAIIGIVVVTLDYEYSYSNDRNSTNCSISTRRTDLYLILNLLTTFISLWFLLLRYYIKNRRESYLSEKEIYIPVTMSLSKFPVEQVYDKKPFFTKLRIIEIVTLLIIPYPYVDWKIYIPLRHQYETIWTCYTFAEVTYFFMFARFMFLIRALANYTPYENYIARRYCQKNHVSANLRFSFKCMMKKSPVIKTITFMAIPSLFILSQMLRIFERPLDEITGQDFQNPLNALWCMFASMSTVGYGDFYPISICGRIAVVLGYIMGALSLTIVIVRFGSFVSLNEKQNKAFMSILMTSAAAITIQAGMKYFVSKIKRGKGHPISVSLYGKYKEAVYDFQHKKGELNEIVGQKEKAIKEARARCANIDAEVNRLLKKADNLSKMIRNMNNDTSLT
ncbi:unnamed protein product [Blepharisma stoltei]|uniref:Potassium channel domain-containing protein n=1 Tax=Blepharisma stoltei TaxID=1481888 RepID=A0AAU9IE35_9CILI|nr:unnamed protein product [Blepharisma stoltei]